MIDPINGLVTSSTNIVSPARVPLPSLDKANALCDDAITNFVRPSHELMMEGDVSSHPLRGFAVFNSILVPVLKVCG